MGDAIGVMIAEREALFRRGPTGCLETDSGLRVLASVATAEDAYREADTLLPSVALVGTTLVDAPGITAAAELRRRFPVLATVVVTDVESDD